MKNLLTLRNDSSFAVEFSDSVSKTRAIFLFTGAIHSTEISGKFGSKTYWIGSVQPEKFEKTGSPYEVDHFSRSEFWLNGSRPMIKIIKMYKLHASMPTVFRQSANKKKLPGFRIVVTSVDGINGWSIQTLLRGENDSKQSDEIQAIHT